MSNPKYSSMATTSYTESSESKPSSSKVAARESLAVLHLAAVLSTWNTLASTSSSKATWVGSEDEVNAKQFLTTGTRMCASGLVRVLAERVKSLLNMLFSDLNQKLMNIIIVEPTNSSFMLPLLLQFDVTDACCPYYNLMTEQKIKIRLPNAREKLQSLFPEDVRGDIRIIMGKRSFRLQKAFLRLQSGYFKRAFTQTSDTLEIKQEFDENYFANVLRCFYGFTIEVSRAEVLDYYPILKFLEVDALIKAVKEDMAARADAYDVFGLLQIAHQFSEQELFQVGLAQLQKEGYEQLRYAKHQLLRCPTELFKLVVKTHNRLKAETSRGISIVQVDQLIRDFSDQQHLSEAQYQDLKFELIDKKSLSSQEYKEVFLDDAKRKRNTLEYRSMVRLQPEVGASSTFNSHLLSAGKLTESVIEPIKKNDQLTLELENTYEKKKNEQLQAENTYLTNELNDLRAKSSDHAASIELLKELASRLQARLQDKDRIDKEQTNIIKHLEKMCQDLKAEIAARNDIIRKLEERLQRLQRQPDKRNAGNTPQRSYQEDQASKTVQSQIVPAHLLKEYAAKPAQEGFKKSKQLASPAAPQEHQLDEEQLEELYSSRLEFDNEPVGCSKKLLPHLANFITTDGFQKKKLELLLRRGASEVQAVGSPNDIHHKNSLLFLLCTKSDLVIGGFTSIELSETSTGYLADENAYVFTLSKNQKFPIKKSHISEAIFISPDYIIGFSNDIMISRDSINVQCECDWPDAYQTGPEKRNAKWLTGQDSAFSLKSIQVYEVKQEEMIMDL